MFLRSRSKFTYFALSAYASATTFNVEEPTPLKELFPNGDIPDLTGKTINVTTQKIETNFESMLRSGGGETVHEYGITCGWLDPTDALRVVNGVDTDINAIPWQVRYLIVYVENGQYYGGRCGGTILNNQWSLSAAHCFGDNIEYILVYPGATNAVAGIAPGYKVVDTVVKHEKYGVEDIPSFGYDIALAKQLTGNEFTFTSDIYPACLPSANMCLTDNHVATISGWGTTEFLGSTSDVLQSAEVHLTKFGDCLWSWNNEKSAFLSDGDWFIKEYQICAGGWLREGETIAKDSCQGDSGGPLTFFDDDNTGTVIGVVSFGNGCADLSEPPPVYTRVSSFIDWIYDHTGIRMQGNVDPVNPCHDTVTGFEAGLTNSDVIPYVSDSYSDESPVDFEARINLPDLPNACLAKAERQEGVDYRLGKFLVVVPDCTSTDPLDFNGNLQWTYDESTGRMYQNVMDDDRYCLFRSTTNAYVTKCEHMYFPGVRPRQQWDWLPTNGALIGRDRDNRVFRALYYEPDQLNGSEELRVHVGTYLFSNFDSIPEDEYKGISLIYEENDKIFDTTYHICSWPIFVGEGSEIEFYDECDWLDFDTGFKYDPVTQHITFYDGYDSQDEFCLRRTSTHGPVVLSDCTQAASAPEEFEWVFDTDRIYSYNPSNASEMKYCLFVHQIQEILYVGDCSGKNFRFGEIF